VYPFYHVHAPLTQEKNSDAHGKPKSRTTMKCTLLVQFSPDGTTNTFIIPTSHLNDSH
ncbi:hypothetical protein K503DRAFT_776805, partial [Rhizopogon vinicolor AM-OR11-026]